MILAVLVFLGGVGAAFVLAGSPVPAAGAPAALAFACNRDGNREIYD